MLTFFYSIQYLPNLLLVLLFLGQKIILIQNHKSYLIKYVESSGNLSVVLFLSPLIIIFIVITSIPLVTWADLPYVEVLKSGHRTADLGSLNHTFFCGLKLPTLAV